MKTIESSIGFENQRLVPETAAEKALLTGWVKLYGVSKIEEDDTSCYWRIAKWRFGEQNPSYVASFGWDDLTWSADGIGTATAAFNEYPFNPCQSISDTEFLTVQVIVEVDGYGALMKPTWIIGDQKNQLPYTPSFRYQ